MWVKVCGNTNLDDARMAIDAGADAIGFVFAPSPRRVEPAAVRDIVAQLPPHIEKLGVFVNETAERIGAIVREAGLSGVQLHGDEGPEFARLLRGMPESHQGRFRIVKSLPVYPGFEIEVRAFAESGAVDAVLLDAATDRARGGTGETFDWSRAAGFVTGAAKQMRIIVAGGLNDANVADAIAVLAPWGVDVCSGVETSPGRKDRGKVWAFVNAARAAARSRA